MLYPDKMDGSDGGGEVHSTDFRKVDTDAFSTKVEKFEKPTSRKGFFFCLFLHIGLLEAKNTPKRVRVVARIVQISALVVVVDYWVSAFIHYNEPRFQWKTTLGYSLSCAMTIATYLAMIFRSRRIMGVIRDEDDPRIDKIAMVLVASPLAYALFSVSFFRHNHLRDLEAFYTYGYVVDSLWGSLVVYSKNAALNFAYTFPNQVTLLYCDLCHRCRLPLKTLTELVEGCDPGNFTPALQSEVLETKRRAVTGLETFQNLFSLPSFLVCVANFTSCFSALGSFLSQSPAGSTSGFEIVDVVYTVCNSLGSLVALFVVGGQVPLQMEQLVAAFRDKFERRVLMGIEMSPNEPLLMASLQNQPIFVLSGCKTLFYKRQSVLAALGTILTYGLLIINMDLPKK